MPEAHPSLHQPFGQHTRNAGSNPLNDVSFATQSYSRKSHNLLSRHNTHHLMKFFSHVHQAIESDTLTDMIRLVASQTTADEFQLEEPMPEKEDKDPKYNKL